MSLIDFTNCEIDLIANYGGSDKKRGVIYNGKRYMLKLSDRINKDKRNELNSSYSNSAYSEYVSCHILEGIGFKVQKTLLGIIRLESSKNIERIYPVVACENFVHDNWHLVEFKFIESSLLEDKPGKTPKLSHLNEIFKNENVYFSKEFGKTALQAYWDTFIADAFLANFDRHGNNWGYLVNDITNEIVLAPIYDCGSCLYPQISDEAIPNVLNSKEEVQKRIDVFPTAALKVGNEKVSYKEYISSFENEDCTNALLRITPKIDMQKIKGIINNTDGISDIRKKFYFEMLSQRYQQIILKPYKELMQRRCIINSSPKR